MPQYIALKILNDGCEIFLKIIIWIFVKNRFQQSYYLFSVIHRIPIHSDEIKKEYI